MTKPAAAMKINEALQDYALRTPEEPKVRDKNIRDPERTAAAILAAATCEFAENGYGGARINEIAARADVNKRMLYHYFGGKDALYLAVLEATYIGIRSAEFDLHLTDRDPVEAIRELARFTWQYFLDHPEFLSIISTENLLKAKFLREQRYHRETLTADFQYHRNLRTRPSPGPVSGWGRSRSRLSQHCRPGVLLPVKSPYNFDYF